MISWNISEHSKVDKSGKIYLNYRWPRAKQMAKSLYVILLDLLAITIKIV